MRGTPHRIEKTDRKRTQSVDFRQSPVYILLSSVKCVPHQSMSGGIRGYPFQVLNMFKTWNGHPRTKEYGSFPVLIRSVRNCPVLVLYMSGTCSVYIRYNPEVVR